MAESGQQSQRPDGGSGLEPFTGTERLHCHGLPSHPVPETGTVLVTGSTGYIGGRLVPELQARGYRVRAMVRAVSPEHEERWPGAQIAVADAFDSAALAKALAGVDTAYYLIHSLLLGPKRFQAADLTSARNFRQAAEAAGIRRIIYLGGLGDVSTRLSQHLRSRAEVTNELTRGRVPVTVLRAAIIIGSGSASYEIIKHLVRNLPVIFVPPWARNRCQPIAARDVIRYLVGALESPAMEGQSYDIGGSEVLSYEDMMRRLAAMLGLRRLFVPGIPANIKLYSYLGSLLTPVPASMTRCLMEGLANDVVCENDEVRRILPFAPMTYSEALLDAMAREEQDKVETRWSDAYPPAHELAPRLRDLDGPARYTACYSISSRAAAPDLFRSICRIGGKEGWLHSNWMWRLRGMVDRILAGVGTSRGRRSRTTLRINDVIDFWRVEDLSSNRMLLLRAEMKMPGSAWLRFDIVPAAAGVNRLTTKAYYEPRGLAGVIYWYTFLPFHHFIFANLIREIERRSWSFGRHDAR